MKYCVVRFLRSANCISEKRYCKAMGGVMYICIPCSSFSDGGVDADKCQPRR